MQHTELSRGLRDDLEGWTAGWEGGSRARVICVHTADHVVVQQKATQQWKAIIVQ